MQTENALVSIIVPCYNGKRFVDACMNTLLAQTYKRLEIVVVDDGSTDGSYDLIMNYASAFEAQGMLFKCVRQANRGLAGAIDTGLKHISGKYLQLLDIDDLLMASSVEDKLKLFEDGVAIVRSNGMIVRGGEAVGKSFVENKKSGFEEMLFDDLVEINTFNWAGSYMVSTELLFDFYPNRTIHLSRHGQNLQLLMPLAYKYKSVFLDKPLMKYIKWDNSLSAATGSNDEYEKLKTNMLGYTDIRKHMISIVVDDKAKEAEYIRKAEAKARFMILCYACQYKNKAEAKEYYKKLKSVDALNRDTKWMYYRFMYPIIGKLKDLF